MAEESGANRADRRRAEKEPFKLPMEFDTCPNPDCGSKRLFVEEALKHDVNLEGLGGKTPALFSFEYAYDTPTGPVQLIAVGDVCVDCGLPRIVVMDKVRSMPKPTLHLPPGASRG
ncbi:hypothetical protein LCGC14_2274580 [marine sediment metagenome]|uniref:Uncharacterized protein n=1 Tax=marine sediment metagenome TaxID=412755 RepID=A0A0F9CW55_9ZZZZ